MTISKRLINDLRKKTAVGPWAFLIDFYSKEGGRIMSLTNNKDDIVKETITYKEFPFVVSIPEFSDSLDSKIQLTFINFPYKSFPKIKNQIALVKKARFIFANVNYLDNQFFEDAYYFLSTGDIFSFNDNSVILTLSKKVLSDTNFPFRRYNSEQHPLIYDEFNGIKEIIGR